MIDAKRDWVECGLAEWHNADLTHTIYTQTLRPVHGGKSCAPPPPSDQPKIGWMGVKGSRQVAFYRNTPLMTLCWVRPPHWGGVHTNTQAPTHTKKGKKSPGLAERYSTECVLVECDSSDCDMSEQYS